MPKNPFLDDHWYTSGQAGAATGRGRTLFEVMHEERVQEGVEADAPWVPFASEEEWGLAQWMMHSGLSQSEIDRYLKLDIIQNRLPLSFKDKRAFFKKIDSLPRGPGWQCELFELQCEERSEGESGVEVFELWKRNPVECIRELLSNPTFKDNLRYAPEQRYEDDRGERPVLGEMWSGAWWERVQVSKRKLLPKGATLVPVILASDKTQLSNFSGDKSAWPVYLTIGNIPKSLRRSPSSHATVLLGYLPVAKLESVPKAKRAVLAYQLFHDCMRSLLEPLVEAGRKGVEVVCADGYVRRAHPIVAAYVADHPEQCLVACCQENHCPKCLVQPNKRGVPVDLPVMRDPEKMLAMICSALEGNKGPGFAEAGLRSIHPFWANLPHCDIFTCLTPDLLHQLHKGVFKDHTVKWATACMDGKEDEVNRRFRTMPLHPDLRHFKKGISLVSQWTGNEYKQMEKVFLGVVAGAADPDVVKAVRAVLDFVYYAHYEAHTEDSLSCLQDAWIRFHLHKHGFVRLGVCDDFNIPKLHSMSHYIDSIRLFGLADGYNTEGPERLHIDFAKLGYRASNRKQYIQQMTTWMERQDAVRRFDQYLQWLKAGHNSQLPSRSGDNNTEEAEDAEKDGEEVEQETAPESHARADVDSEEYTISKRPAFPSTSVKTITEEFGALDFIRCLEDFVTKTAASNAHSFLRVVNMYTTFSVYKQFKKRLPRMSQVSKTLAMDSIRAIPAKSAGGLRPATPSQFSTVLAREGVVDSTQDSEREDGISSHPLDGMTVGQVRLLFRLSSNMEHVSKHPLAYIEWYTPFHRYDDLTGMFSVAPSQRLHRRRASIIPITSIVRTCHLIPAWGRVHVARTDWTSENVLQRCDRFYVNAYLRHSDFVLFRQLVDNWRRSRSITV
ncbi:hypothetical protein BC835DRAFT_1272404 [Cytidiella melzeri]|nr:hypothetical protein BC835DRAFT_1272404 [Cytidiella melzeri]